MREGGRERARRVIETREREKKKDGKRGGGRWAGEARSSAKAQSMALDFIRTYSTVYCYKMTWEEKHKYSGY